MALKTLKKAYLILMTNLIRDKNGKPIEPKIKPLVIALNSKRYRTTMSCEGHSLKEWEERMCEMCGDNAELIFRAEKGLVYRIKSEDGSFKEQIYNETPWVDVKLSETQRRTLEKALQYHSQRTGIVWATERFSQPDDEYRIEALPKYDLPQMQADIAELAKDVLEKG